MERIGIILTLVLLASVSSASAATATDSYGDTVATITAPDTVTPDTDFDVMVEGTLVGGSGFSVFAYAVWEDAEWYYAPGHSVRITSGTLIDGSGFAWGSSYTNTYTFNKPAGSYKYMFLMGDRRFGHGWYDVAVDVYVEVGSADADGDGYTDDVDNCPYVQNPDQRDTNGDGIGNACQQDYDNDLVNDNIDNCPEVANPLQENADLDPRGDACDLCPNDPTDACASVNVTVNATNGGTAENSAGTASVNVPPGAVSQETTISVIGDSATSNYAVGRDPTNLIIGYVYTFQPEGLTFNTPVEITLFYEQGGLKEGGGAERALDIYYYDAVSGWIAQNSQQNMTNFAKEGKEYGGTLTLVVDHFSSYAIIAIRDNDNDGVVITEDVCPETEEGAAVNAEGCSVVQLCQAEGYKNHGEYVSCVAHTTNAFKAEGLITGKEKGEIVKEAAKSDIGK